MVRPERREDAVELGKTALSRAMRKAALPLQRLLGGNQLLTIAREMHLADVSALYAAVGEGHVSAQSVVQRLVGPTRRTRRRGRRHRRDRHPVRALTRRVLAAAQGATSASWSRG